MSRAPASLLQAVYLNAIASSVAARAKTKGGVAVISPKDGKLVKTHEVEKCAPNHLAFGPMKTSCSVCSARGNDGMPPVIKIMNATSRTEILDGEEIIQARIRGESARSIANR